MRLSDKSYEYITEALIKAEKTLTDCKFDFMKGSYESEVKRIKSIKDDMFLRDIFLNMDSEDKNLIINEILKYNIIDSMFHKGYIPYVYNQCHGGGPFSLYFRRLVMSIKEKTKDFPGKEREEINFIKAKVIYYLGEKADGEYSSPGVDFVKRELLEFVVKNEYDGLESIEIDYDMALRIKVKTILDDDSNDSDKISLIRKMINVYSDDSDIICMEENLVIEEGESVIKLC